MPPAFTKGFGAMPGPLPEPNRRRRNAPTIPTTKLPAAGRAGRVPSAPSWCELAKAGKAWWAWAWKTPQAAAWSVGDEPMIARRAALEDDLAALAAVESLDLADVLEQDDARRLRDVITRLAALATGRLQIMREMRELDDRLGLTPKGLAALRWTIVAPERPADTKAPSSVARLDDRRTRLTAANAS